MFSSSEAPEPVEGTESRSNFSTRFARSKKTPLIGPFLFGGALGLSWTPCVGPILIALLALASTLQSAVKGGILLLVYALGLGLPLVLFSSLLQRAPRDGKLWNVLRGREFTLKLGSREIRLHTTSIISGLLFIALGYLIFSGTLYIFNRYVTGTEFQKWFFGIEEWILGMIST